MAGIVRTHTEGDKRYAVVGFGQMLVRLTGDGEDVYAVVPRDQSAIDDFEYAEAYHGMTGGSFERSFVERYDPLTEAATNAMSALEGLRDAVRWSARANPDVNVTALEAVTDGGAYEAIGKWLKGVDILTGRGETPDGAERIESAYMETVTNFMSVFQSEE